MKKDILFFLFALFMCPAVSMAATCSQMNLTRCLDSVCAINTSSNPAARCQYCGTASAGTPPTIASGMRSLSLGQSTKYTLTEDELKAAPTDPGQRYIWATEQCIAKVSGCTVEDVSDIYDELIEQSCRAAGVTAQMSATISAVNTRQTSATGCLSTIQACIIDEKRCGPNYAACEDDTSFNNFFSACSVEASGCGDYIAEIRTNLTNARDTAIKNADLLIASIVAGYQSAREQKVYSVQESCKNDTALNTCIETICQRSMPNQCATGYESERSSATLFCQFYKVACNVLE